MCRTIILLVLAAGAEAVKALKGTRLASNVALNRTFDSPVPKDVSDLETTVHELLQQDATPSLANFAKQLEKIIEDEMMAAVKKVKASLQTELDGHYASGYDKCDTSMQGSTEVSTKSSTFSSAASQHSTCRKEEGEAETAKSTCDKEEADLLSEKEKLCKVVSDYNAINNGNCAKQSGETYVTYTRRLKEFYEAEEKKGIAAEEACKKATDEHATKAKVCADLKSTWTKKKTACDSQQDTMDAAACTILSTSQTVCQEYDDCYTAATSSYNNDKTSVATQEAAIKNEWKALLHLKCLLDVFGKSNDEKQAAISACNGKNFDSEANSAVSLTYPSPVPRGKKTCSEAAPATVAGRDEYKAKYYALPSNAPAKTCEASCCATCDSFTCPDGWVSKDNAASIFGELRDVCCVESFLPGTKLVATKAQDDKLMSWLKSDIKNKNWVKCYTKTTRTSNKQWVSKCGGKWNLLTLIKTSGGKVIGGYNYQYFRTSGGNYVGDTNAFLFSLSNLHKHSGNQNVGSYGIYYHATAYSACFGGGHDLCVPLDESSKAWSNLGHTYWCRTGSSGSNACRSDFLGQTGSFQVEEMETYYYNR